MNFWIQSVLLLLLLSVMDSKDVFFGSGLNLSLSDEETSGNLWSTTLHDKTFAPGEFNVDYRFVSFFLLLSFTCCQVSSLKCTEGSLQLLFHQVSQNFAFEFQLHLHVNTERQNAGCVH